METTRTINEFITSLQQKVGVVATVSADGKPEAAVVHFSHDENLNIYLTTRAHTRKHQNILKSPQVAFVIYTEHPAKTVQLQGTARIITDPYEQTLHFSEIVDNANKGTDEPPIDQLSEEEIVFIQINTTWIRTGDFEIDKKSGVFEEVTVPEK